MNSYARLSVLAGGYESFPEKSSVGNLFSQSRYKIFGIRVQVSSLLERKQQIGTGISKTYPQNNVNSLEIRFNQNKASDCRNSSFFCLCVRVICALTYLCKIKQKMH